MTNLWEDFLNKEDIHNWIMRANRYWLKNNGWKANNLSANDLLFNA
nr:hypothetical protein [Mycoplasmopsis bovis]